MKVAKKEYEVGDIFFVSQYNYDNASREKIICLL